jgi:sugar phosphate isomerase/epimerase
MNRLEGPGPKTTAPFSPRLGVCTSIANAAAAMSSGCDYLEESARGFLVPDRPEQEFREKAEAVAGAGLPILACNSFLPGTLKSVGPEAAHDKIIAYAETAFSRAQEIGIKTIVFGSGDSRAIPDGFDRGEARRQFVSLLRRMGPVARKYDVLVVVEPLQRTECNFINTVAEGAAIVKEVADPNIQLLADIYHMLRENEGPESIVAAGPLLRHIHIAEKANRTPPGVAGDDFTPYLEALRRIGYSGAISIECRWDDLAGQLPRAVTTLKDQIAKVNASDSGKYYEEQKVCCIILAAPRVPAWRYGNLKTCIFCPAR